MGGPRARDISPLASLGPMLAILKKDLRIYYLKPPTIMFGVLFPVFLFISFALGRDLPVEVLVPGLTAMAMFFGSSSTGAMAIPTERRTGTYERLLVAPVPPAHILLGETLGGFVFGAAFAAVPVAIGLLWYGMGVSSVPVLLLAVLLSSFAFSAMGIMFAAFPTKNTGDVMMALNFVRLPLLFVSGVFIPLEDTGPLGMALATVSPLTYSNDLLRWAISGAGGFALSVDVLGIAVFSTVFLCLALWLHERARMSDRLAGGRARGSLTTRR